MANRIDIYTFKEGLLSKVAHDLRLSLEGFSIEKKEDNLVVVLDPFQIRVIGAMKKNRLNERALSEKDKRDIIENMHKESLKSKRYPQIRFVAPWPKEKADFFTLKGELTLCGKTKTISLMVRKNDQAFVSEVEFLQSEFGIKPFSALLGSLKIKDRVRIEIEVDAQI